MKSKKYIRNLEEVPIKLDDTMTNKTKSIIDKSRKIKDRKVEDIVPAKDKSPDDMEIFDS